MKKSVRRITGKEKITNDIYDATRSMLTKQNCMYVCLCRLTNNFRIGIKLLKLVTSENPAGRRRVREGCWMEEDVTFSGMYYCAL